MALVKKSGTSGLLCQAAGLVLSFGLLIPVWAQATSKKHDHDRDDDARLVFVRQPSKSGEAGKPLRQAPILRASIRHRPGHPACTEKLKPLKNVKIAAYTDAKCTKPARGVLTARVRERLARIGIAAFRDVTQSVGGNIYLGVSAQGVDAACSRLVDIVAAPTGGDPSPVVLALTGPASSVAGTCSAAFTVKTLNASGQPVPQAASRVVALGGVGNAAIFSDASCAQAAANGITIASGQSSAAFYVKDLRAEALSLSASSAGAASSQASSFVIRAAAPARLEVFSGDAQAATVGTQLSLPVVVRVTDAFDNPASGAGVAFALASGGGTVSPTISSSDAQGFAQAAVTVGQVAGSNSIIAAGSDQGLVSWADSAHLPSVTLTATGTAGSASRLVLSGGSASIRAGDCSSAFTVSLRDEFGNSARATEALSVQLGGAGSGGFYGDSACAAGSVGSIDVRSGASQAVFYFSGTAAQNLILTASAQGAQGVTVTGSTIPLTVLVGAASRIAISAGDAQSAIAGSALSVDPAVLVADSFGNPVEGEQVSFAVEAGGGSLGASRVTTDAAGVALVRFTLGPVAGGNSLTASISSGASVRFVAVGLAKPPVAIRIDGPSSLRAGACSEAYSLQLLDDAQAPTIAGSPVDVALSGVGGGAFYSDPGCGQAVTGVSIPAAAGVAQFYLRDTRAETLSISAGATGLASVSLSVSISPAAAHRLAYSAPPSASGVAGVAFALQPAVQALDAYGNLAEGFSSPVTLAAFSSDTCAAAAPGTLVAQSNPATAASGQALFSGVAYDSPGVVYLGASAAGVASACSPAIAVTASMTLAAGTAHSCALKDGSVKCWGVNGSGTLGNGSNTNASTPQQVVGMAGGALTMGAGGQHTCAATAAGLFCWGLNAAGQLGDGTSVNRNLPVAVSSIGAGVIQIVGGDSHTCVLIDGSVRCWGDNSFGQLGDGSNSSSPIPVAVQGLGHSVRSIAAASVSTCAVLTDGSAYCWGYNSSGQLGDGTTVSRNLPVRVQGLGSVTTIAPGIEHNCALVGDQVYCWGQNTFGQLGTGDFSASGAPRLVQGLAGGVTTLLSGGQNFNCAIIAGGAVQCWGQNLRGQLGDNRVSGSQSPNPVQVVGLTGGIKALHAGYIHACASDGSAIKCWGWGSSGQLGNGATAQSSVPVSVFGYP